MATERFITLPSGRELTFPEGTSDDEVYNAYYDALPDDILGGIGPKEKEQAGFAGALGEGLQTIGGLPEALRYLADPSAETRKALIEDTDPEYKYQDFYDIGEGTALERVGKGGQFFKELLGGSLGQMALPTIGGGIASFFGTPLLGAGVFSTLAAAQYTPEIAGRQARLSQEGVDKGESPIDPDTAKILGSSFASGALDRVTLAAFPRLQSLLGQNGKAAQQKVGEEIVETAQSRGMLPALGRLLDSDSFTLGTLRGATIEGGQEVIQNMISRFGAGAELSGPEATREYIASGVGGALLGGPVGALDIAAKKITRVAAEQQGQAEKERGLREERVARNQEAQTDIYVSPVRTDFDNNKVDFTPENLVDLGFNEDVKSFKAADYNPTVAQLIDKSTDDMPETSTVFTSLLDSFEDIEQNILLNKGKSQDIETDRKTQEQLRKMMPGLKGMAKKILDYAKSQKLEVLEKKKDTTGQKKQIDFQYKDEKDLSSQELYNQTKENLRLARIAANKIADTHTTEIRARKEAEDAKKKANKQKLEDENKTTGTVAADEQAQEKKEVEEIFGFEQEIDPDTGKKSRIKIEAGSPEDAARNFLRDYIKEYNKNEKKRPLNATETENVFLDRIDNSNLNDSEKERANELINIEMFERFGLEDFKTKQGANRGFRIPKDKTKTAIKRQNKKLLAQLQAKQLESQKLVKSFNTTNSNLKEGLFGSDTEFFDNAFEKLKDLTDEISVDPEKTQNIIDEIKSYGEDLKKARENPDKDGSVETELQKERMAIDNLINEIRQEAENSTLDSNADLKEATNENIEDADDPQGTKKATNEVVNESMTDGCTGSKK